MERIIHNINYILVGILLILFIIFVIIQKQIVKSEDNIAILRYKILNFFSDLNTTYMIEKKQMEISKHKTDIVGINSKNVKLYKLIKEISGGLNNGIVLDRIFISNSKPYLKGDFNIMLEGSAESYTKLRAGLVLLEGSPYLRDAEILRITDIDDKAIEFKSTIKYIW